MESTAKAAKLAVKEEGSAAICSHIAARLYGLPILFDNIEDVHTNKTRFIIVSDFKNQPSGEDKTTVLAKIADRPGSLADFLQDFNRAGINLTKIESRPAKSEKAFTSWFYIDFEGHYEENNIKQVLANHTNEIKWLGRSMKRGNPSNWWSGSSASNRTRSSNWPPTKTPRGAAPK